MLRYIFPILAIFLVLSGVGYFLLNTPVLVSYFAPRFFALYFKEVQLENCHFERQSFTFPDTLTLTNTKFTIIKDDEAFNFTVPTIILEDVMNSWKADRQLKASVQDLNMESSLIKLNHTDAKILLGFAEQSLSYWDSLFGNVEFKFDPYVIDNLSGRMRGNREKIELFELNAAAYGGEIKGQITWNYNPTAGYIVYLEFADLKAAALQQLDQKLFSQIGEAFSGTLRVAGSQRHVDILALNAALSKPGFITSRLIKDIIAANSVGEQPPELQVLLEGKDQFAIDSGKFSIYNTDPNHRAIIDLTLVSKADNITIKGLIPFDIGQSLQKYLRQNK